jgi:hypothetical protein
VAGPLQLVVRHGLDLDGTIRTGGPTVLVGDSTPPAAPAVGRYDVDAEPGTTIDAGGAPVQIFSAHRDLGAGGIAPDLRINGVTFAPGRDSVQSATEQWNQSWNAALPAPSVTPYQLVYETGDRIPPTATIDLLSASTLPALGEVVRIRHACADTGGSGLVSCDITNVRDDVLDTAAAGPHTITLTAVDGAGNRTVVTRSYTVRAPVVRVQLPVRPARPRRVCVRPATMVLKLERPKRVRSVVAVFEGRRQKVKLSPTRIVITVDVHAWTSGKYPLKVTIRRSHRMRTVVRHPNLIVRMCTR